MKISYKKASVLAASALALLITGCNSPKEKAAEKTADLIENNADTVRDIADDTADKMESRADKMDTKMDGKDPPAEMVRDNQAAAIRADADVKATVMENTADAVRKDAKNK